MDKVDKVQRQQGRGTRMWRRDEDEGQQQRGILDNERESDVGHGRMVQWYYDKLAAKFLPPDGVLYIVGRTDVSLQMQQP